jgi:6-phosphogluconolactonase
MNSYLKTAKERLLLVGTYTKGESKGLYALSFNTENGTIKQLSTTNEIENPSFLTLSPCKRFVYVVSEQAEYKGEKTGSVAAYRLNEETGELTKLNEQPSHGKHPCHLSVTPDGEYLCVANYSSGTLSVYPLTHEGLMGEATDIVQHEGTGPNKGRQEGPHAHSVYICGDEVVSADLGIDKVMRYRLEKTTGKLHPHPEFAWSAVAPGAGPRHIAFHSSGKQLFVVNELDSTITSFVVKRDGKWEQIQTVSTLPTDFKGKSYPADIHLSLCEQFLYASNRGHDTLVIYRLNQETGQLSYVGLQSVRGQTPRNFTIDPTGQFVLVANQDSSDIHVFQINQQTGELIETDQSMTLPFPVCLQFI